MSTGPFPFGEPDPLCDHATRERELRELAQRLCASDEGDRAAAEEEYRRAGVGEIPFVETSVSGLIFGVIGRCMTFRKNGLVIGAPGIGKTKTLKEALRRSDRLEGPNVGLVTVSATIGGSTMALFEELAPHLGVRPATSIAQTMRRLSKDACFRPVMIFDEAQNLTLKSARELLFISEEANVQMLFVGNDEVLKLVNSQQAAIQQIARRLPFREEIGCIVDQDADLIAEHFGVEEMDAFRMCREVGALLHIDGIVQVLCEARHRIGESKTIRAAHVRAAIDAFPHFRTALNRAAAARPAMSRERTAGVRTLTNGPADKAISNRGGKDVRSARGDTG